jgi:hypothetical protein
MPLDLPSLVIELLAQHGPVIDLDAIGDAIGDRAASMEEIDRLIDALEGAGRQVGVPETGLPSEKLVRVVQSARTLRVSLGRLPTPSEIAAHAALDTAAVRTALLLVRVLQRS